MDKATWTLEQPEQARAAFNAAYARGMARVKDGGTCVLELRPETRTDKQNKRFHALCGEIAERALFHGRKITPVQWKVLLTSGHAQATGNSVELVRGLEGEMVNIRESTARMGVRRMASLMEYVEAFCATNGIEVG